MIYLISNNGHYIGTKESYLKQVWLARSPEAAWKYWGVKPLDDGSGWVFKFSSGDKDCATKKYRSELDAQIFLDFLYRTLCNPLDEEEIEWSRVLDEKVIDYFKKESK